MRLNLSYSGYECEADQIRQIPINLRREGASPSCHFCVTLIRPEDFGDKMKRKYNRVMPRKKDNVEYQSWISMLIRCRYPQHHAWPRYGGRGITVCERWKHSFWDFLDDMGKKSNPSDEIDRIDNNGNYEPKNCKWRSHLDNIRNSSRTRITVETASIIKKLLLAKNKCSDIAKIMNVPIYIIKNIKSNRCWRDILPMITINKENK
jgi:hypothetical protein